MASDIAAAVAVTPEATTGSEVVPAKASPAQPSRYRQPFLRAYEPTSVGYTFQDDEQFMDFTLSMMVPLFHGYYPDRTVAMNAPGADEAGGVLRPYFAFTGRAGQYINTRSSSPVVGKRFNPLLTARYWWWEEGASAGARADTFVELVYGHESNGQRISDELIFVADWQILTANEILRMQREYGEVTDDMREQAAKTGYEAARDEISRGWDYVGLNFSVRGGRFLPSDNHRLQLKLSHYLDWGLLQGDKEDYYPWEDDLEGKPRSFVDGIEVRYDGEMRLGRGRLLNLVEFDTEWALIWKTGIERPFRYHTFEGEFGILINGFPLKLWYRHGYLNDLADYYRKESAGGVRFSFNRFSRDELSEVER